MKIKGILLLSIFTFFNIAQAKECSLALTSTIPYSGGYIDDLPALETLTELYVVANFNNGLVYDQNREVLDLPDGGQFVFNLKKEFLISKDPINMDHKVLGGMLEVFYAGYITVEKGVITNILVKSDSAYKASPQHLVALVYFLEGNGVNLSNTKFSIVREENPEFEISRELLLEKFENIN
ncbi:MAG: hypothetical protein KDD58_04505 [Bdellovibrionales bacterium]|nr:hypothetical protein [Bdellovibrionales bacterium]